MGMNMIYSCSFQWIDYSMQGTEWLGAIVQVVGSALVTLLILGWFTRKFKGLNRLSDVADQFLTKDNTESLSTTFESIQQLGTLSGNVNQILANEEMFDFMLTELAGRIRKSMITSIMGVKSGDSKKLAKAETMVNEGIINFAEKVNPWIGMFLKFSGLGDELRADPEMMGYILQIIGDQGGIAQMLQSGGLMPDSLAMPAPPSGTEKPKTDASGVGSRW